MKRKSYKKNGNIYGFNFEYFNEIFKKEAIKRSATLGEFEEILGEAAFVEKSTVHAWRNRKNAPSDLEKLEIIAQFLEINIDDLLVKRLEALEEKEMTNTVSYRLNDREKDAFKKIYLEMLDYIRKLKKYYEEQNNFLVHWQLEYDRWAEDLYFSQFEDEEECCSEHCNEQHSPEPHYWNDYREHFTEKKEYLHMLDKIKNILLEERIELPEDLYWGLKELCDALIQCEDDLTNSRIIYNSLVGIKYSEWFEMTEEERNEDLKNKYHELIQNNPRLNKKICNQFKYNDKSIDIYKIFEDYIKILLILNKEENEYEIERYLKQLHKNQLERAKFTESIFNELIGEILKLFY